MAAWVEKYRGYMILTLVYVVVLGIVVAYLRRPDPELPVVIQTPTLAVPTTAAEHTLTPALIVVYVSGAVVRPGVYSLPPESRVHEAIQSAGGATAEADLGRVNLADWIRDGQQIYVPAAGEENPPVPPVRQSGVEILPGEAMRSAGGGKININAASAEELQVLPGIGPVYAERIVQYRRDHGPFQRIEDITQVKGIGPKTLEQIAGMITAN